MVAHRRCRRGVQTRRVTEDEAGQRLDRVVAGYLPDVSRSQVQRLIESGRVQVDGRPARCSRIVRAGALVAYPDPSEAHPALPSAPQPEALEIRVVYEDEDVIVVDKPAGMVVHPAPGNWTGTLVNALLARYPELADERWGMSDESTGNDAQPPSSQLRVGVAHRLDKDTSGLIVVARTNRALADFSGQLKRREVQKTYTALVHGHPRPPTGSIAAPIGRHPRQRERMAVVFNGRPALTEYQSIRFFKRMTFVQAHPITGRTHQIRVHFAAMRCPVVGDTVYGPSQPPGPGRQFLHAGRISFRSPSTGRTIDLESPLPPDLAGYLAALS